jgi:metal-responsive CopG/Arc/MetJ family transcriptional regulator
MMRSVRLPDDLARKLRLAAQRQGIGESELIRRAIQDHLDQGVDQSVYDRVADIVGSLASKPGSRARHSGKSFAEIVAEKRRRRWNTR